MCHIFNLSILISPVLFFILPSAKQMYIENSWTFEIIERYNIKMKSLFSYIATVD